MCLFHRIDLLANHSYLLVLRLDYRGCQSCLCSEGDHRDVEDDGVRLSHEKQAEDGNLERLTTVLITFTCAGLILEFLADAIEKLIEARIV